MANLNVEACNAHLAKQLEQQIDLIKGALEAVQEGELRRAILFLSGASQGSDRSVEFINDMIAVRDA